METDSSAVEEFCRLCLKPSTQYLPLFENQTVKMLESLTSMKISYDDPAPNLTCLKCLFDVEFAYKTQQRLIKTEMLLQEKISTEMFIKEEIEEHSNELELLENTTKSEDTEYTDFQLDEQLKKTNVNNENQSLFRCRTCLDEYTNIFEYREHIRQHDTRQCLMCPKLISVSELKEHNQTHESGYCEYCDRQLKNSHSLRNHVRRWHNRPQITCEKCEDVFANKKDFNLHMRRIHTKEHPYICDYCGGKFFKVSSLNKHIKDKHCDDKPFGCNVCGRTFALKSKLSTHQLKHSDKVLFVCELCGKGFKFKCNLNTHKKSVHGCKLEEKFKRSLCCKGFPSKFSLSIHVAQTHYN